MKQLNRTLATLVAMFTLMTMATSTVDPDMDGYLDSGGDWDQYTWTIAPGDWEVLGFARDGDLDIKVFDMNGNLIASDTKADNFPHVTITASRRAQVKIRFINSSNREDLSYVGYLDEE